MNIADYGVKNAEEQYSEQLNIQQQMASLENIAKRHLTKDALSRFGNIKIAHPEKAVQLLLAIAKIVESGYNEVDDIMLKEILSGFQENNHKATIKWR